MARMIDGDKLMELFKEQYLCNKSMKHREEARAWQGAIQLLYDMPTLTQPNEPLTPEELREMGKEPVWVKCLKPNKYINPPTGWRTLEKSLTVTFGVRDEGNVLIERNYGTDWLAYRRPPEEEV